MEKYKICPYCSTRLLQSKTICPNPSCRRLVFSSDLRTNIIFTGGFLVAVIVLLWQGLSLVFWAMSGFHQAEGVRLQQGRDREARERQERIDRAAEQLKEGREAVDKAFPELKNP